MVNFSEIIENPNEVGQEKVYLNSIVPYLKDGNFLFTSNVVKRESDRVTLVMWVSLGDNNKMYPFYATFLNGQILEPHNIIDLEYAPQLK